MKQSYRKDHYSMLVRRLAALEIRRARIDRDYFDKLANLHQEIDAVVKEIHHRELEQSKEHADSLVVR